MVEISIGKSLLIFLLVLVVVLVVLIFGTVVKKAGFTRWWSLLLFVPIVNLIMIWIFAFSKWPTEINT